MSLRRAALALPVAAALATAAAGCGSDLKPGVADQAYSAGLTETTPTVTTPRAAPPAPVDASRTGQVPTDLKTKPKVPKPTGAAPTRLEARDVVTGTGATLASGQTAKVRYVGVLFSNAKEFDSSWKRGKATFDFPVGQGQVIKGWDQGLVGMKVGGRRELIIPADLAYGAQGQPPTIPANAPLVFVIDLVGIGS